MDVLQSYGNKTLNTIMAFLLSIFSIGKRFYGLNSFTFLIISKERRKNRYFSDYFLNNSFQNFNILIILYTEKPIYLVLKSYN